MSQASPSGSDSKMMISRLLVLAVAAAWFATSICNARDTLLMSPDRISEKFTFYPVVQFDTAQATRRRYTRFINNVREEVVSGDEVHGIPRLYNPTKLPESDRYLQVALFNSYQERIILAIDKVNLYLVGYRTVNKACFFNDTNGPETSSLFPGVERYQLPFKGSYWFMEEIAGSRKNITLGMSELDKCINNLYQLNETASLARCLIVTIQMVAEAVRYRYVEALVVEHISETSQSYLPTPTMIAFEENWKDLSARIQESVGGVIYPPFVLTDTSNQEVTITSITPTLGRNIAVVLYVCDSNCTNVPEPAVHIIGRNGLCADVQDGIYDDGNPVIMWPCTSNTNQLWTLMKDGTIRSKGKCLTAYRLEMEEYVMIHNCSTKPGYSGNKWERKDNGDIISKESKLALNAYPGYSWSILTVDQKSYSSSQGWSLSNSTDP